MTLPKVLEIFDLSNNYIGNIELSYKELTCTFKVNPKLYKYDSALGLKWLKERENKYPYSIEIICTHLNKEIHISGNEMERLRIYFDMDRENSGQLFRFDSTIPIAILVSKI